MSGNASPRGSTTTSVAVENDNRAAKNNRRTSNLSQQDQLNNDSPPPSPVGSGADRNNKACCFCWCCCCSCSCLTLKNREPNKNQNKEATKLEKLQESNEPPTAEEIILWSQSFDKLMGNLCGRRTFREFLRSEYSEENMLFWMACEDLKNENNAELVEEKARLIYEDYISILSPKEVSLDSRVREVINRNMVDPTPHTFDEAQLQIYTLMHRDSYPRFLNSQIYKRLVQQTQTTGSQSSQLLLLQQQQQQKQQCSQSTSS
ncbi:regulator of G-protein signaling 17-like [Tubulanus polymorphus]|uniref:regulator of G-protein signaling 17-like n=1 Tax=Tubulanus polymorphus TaxID=672921 RepID=UPI003DA4F5BB